MRVRDEKVQGRCALRPIPPGRGASTCVRGQYGRGFVDGEPVPGYREEEGVSPDSQTETYVGAASSTSTTGAGPGVPFYLRTGKRLPKRVDRDRGPVQARAAPALLGTRRPSSSSPTCSSCASSPTRASRCASAPRCPARAADPHRRTWTSGTARRFGRRRPRPTSAPARRHARRRHAFTRADEVERRGGSSSRCSTPGRTTAARRTLYPAGTWGPEAADDLLARDRRRWRRL